MKKISKVNLIIGFFSLLPILLVAVLYSRLPNQVPQNWGLNGVVEYADKSSIWVLTFLSPILAITFRVLPKIDPRKKNYEKFQSFYDGFCIFMSIFLLGITVLVIQQSFYPNSLPTDYVTKGIIAGCGLLFIFLGNMLPKVKSNFFLGIKTPWALSNAEVWNKTHRLAGFFFFFGGILIIIFAFLFKDLVLLITILAVAVSAALIPSIMSYVWYKQLPDSERNRQ